VAHGLDEVPAPADGGLFPGSGNTNVIHHAGRIWAINELSLPYEISTELETLRRWDFGGPLPAGSQSYDSATGTWVIAAGGADISIAPLSVTPKRLEVVNFVVYSKSSLCFFGLADNPKLQGVTTVDGLDKPEITMAFFTGTPPETWAPGRFPKMKFRAVPGSGANAPVEEILSKRADIASIDNVAWPNLAASVKGLTVFPKGDGCLQSHEMEAITAMAIDKGDPVFLAWLTAVKDEMKPKLVAEELRILKSVKPAP